MSIADNTMIQYYEVATEAVTKQIAANLRRAADEVDHIIKTTTEDPELTSFDSVAEIHTLIDNMNNNLRRDLLLYYSTRALKVYREEESNNNG